MRKFLVVFAAVLLPLVADAVTFGPEVAASAPRYAGATGGQNMGSLACGGDSCVALWLETADYARQGLYSSVIGADGTVSPPSSNLLQAGSFNNASIVWTGDHYLATWVDGNSSTLYAAPIGADGRFAGEVQTISSHALFGLPSARSLAWNGRHALVVFNTRTGLVAALLDANGVLIRMLPLPILNASSYVVSAAGQTFAIVWAETKSVTVASPAPPPTVSHATIYLQRYDDSGDAIGQPVVLGADMPVNQPQLAMAGNGSQFGIAFSAANDGSMQRLRVDAATGTIDTLPLLRYFPQISGIYWSGDDFVAYGGDGNAVDTEQFSFDALRVLNVTTTQAVVPQIAALGSGAVMTWSDFAPFPGTMHVLGALADREASEVLKAGLVVSRSAMPQTAPLLADSPSGPLLVWNEEQTDGSGELLTRSVASGIPEIIPIASEVPSNGTSLAWVGNVFVVVWPSGGSIVGKRLTSSGAVLDTEPVVFGKGTEAVLTSSFVAFANSDGIWLVRLNANGGAIDSQPIAITSRLGYGLAAAGSGSESVVAWTEGSNWWQMPSPNYRDIFAVRIGPSGLPMDAAPIAIAATGADEVQPAVTSDGRDFLFVYTNDAKVLAKRLLREGTVVDTGTTLGTYASLPRIAFTGARYILTFSDYSAEHWHGIAAALDIDGRVVEPPVEFTAADSPFPLQIVVLPSVVAYSRGNAADEGIPRVFEREILTLPAKARAVRH
ncbi:MAG TPA: hypothetical protein VGR95_01895 [Thermoanaerobaculia bacterium]|nr:hypothetical protein [Thermoanaerobaculia bacterium]